MRKRNVFLLVACFVMCFMGIAGASYSSVVVADNPVYYNSFDGGYDAGVNGYIAEVGNTMNGANMDSAGGASGNCINTTTAGPGSVSISESGAFTYEVWAKSNASTYGSNNFILAPNPYQSPAGVMIAASMGNNKLDFHIGWGAWYQGSVAIADPTQWHQFVITFDNGAAAGGGATSTARVYIDGQLVIENTGGTLVEGNISESLTVGGEPWHEPGLFNGNIDELSVYSGALSANQIEAHFNAIPEPATMILLLGGALGLIRRK